MRPHGAALALAVSFLALAPPPADAVSRPEIMSVARAYEAHTWAMLAKNATASCLASYESYFSPGTTVTGVAYKWGGFDTLAAYDSKLDQGYGAGSNSSALGVLSCVTGVDCSGYVSRTWGTTQKYGTATIHQVSHPIAVGEVQQGDAYNWPSHHIVLWDSYGGDGAPVFYEATPPKVRYTTWASWSYLSSYSPIRYDFVSGDPTIEPGPAVIAIRSLPFHDERNTLSGASNWSSYACAPSTGEAGPEIVYLLDLDAPGTLTAAISDGPGVDVDIHLLSAQDPSACVARDHLTVGPLHVDAGGWVLVVDSWSDSQGTAYGGAYTLDVTFTADAGGCPVGRCGLVCGMCPGGQVCNDEGQCDTATPTEPCGEVSYEGVCDGATLRWCSDEGLQETTCASGCCGWVGAEGRYDCYPVGACASCEDECASGSRGCGEGLTHAWTCVEPASASGCRTRSWTPCEEGCDPTTGQCGGGGCQPTCAGRACGDDGCGGICGTCAAGLACQVGQCVAPCVPVCDGRVCGDDGCGGSCGSCAVGEGCVDGQCLAGCVGSCAGKACGDDGCGGDCGTCPGGGFCVSGICVAECVPSCGARQCGPNGCGGHCGVCPGGERCLGGQCVAACTPSCGARECGDDGCGGSCGACGGGFACDGGDCVPLAGLPDAAGGGDAGAPGGDVAGSDGSGGVGPEATRRASVTEHREGDGCAGAGSGGVPPAGGLGLLLWVAWGYTRRRRVSRGGQKTAAAKA